MIIQYLGLLCIYYNDAILNNIINPIIVAGVVEFII